VLPIGDAFVTGSTQSTNFPTTSGAFQQSNAGYVDAFIARFSAPQPQVSLSPSQVSFGNQNVGIPSSPQNITLTNIGDAILQITSISITGTNPADFSQTNSCGHGIGIGANCTIAVTFTPSRTGSRNANITISDNALNTPQSVSLSGTGVAPSVSLSAASLTFPTQLVATTSPGQSVTLTNTGTATLNITSVVATGDFAQSNTCGSSVIVGGSCTITATFTPTAQDIRTGNVTVTDNAMPNQQIISLSGVGTVVSLSTSQLNFGTQKVGTSSSPATITLKNTGSTMLHLTGIALGGTNRVDFADRNTCQTGIAPGSSCKIGIRFKPSGLGLESGYLSISDDGGGSPQMVILTGTGI
jgi:hypothetical protein